VKTTYTTVLVLQAIAAGNHHGFDVLDATGLPSGTVYPILRRLDREGCLRSRWEAAAIARREGRPPRRYYELTALGAQRLAEGRRRFERAARALGRLRPATERS
jgi:PadR family transcriptional regulator